MSKPTTLSTHNNIDSCFTNSSQSSYGLIFNYCIMSLSFLIGTPANIFCLWFYLREGCRIKANRMFVINHVIIELIACVENAVDILNTIILQIDIIDSVGNFIFGVSWTGRALIQMCICIEQYVAVIHPIIFLKYKDIKYKLAGVVTVYLISSGYGVYEIKHYDFPDPIFNSTYVVVVLVILFCCVSVLCALKKSGPGDKHGNRSTAQEEPNQQKKKAFDIIRTTLIIMLLSYVPMVVLSACYVMSDDWILYYCVLGTTLGSASTFSLIITPLVKIYKEGYMRCSDQRN